MKTGEPFPIKARRFLQAFYNAKNAKTNTEKYEALKDGWNLQSVTFYFDEGHELKTLEFYVLHKMGII